MTEKNERPKRMFFISFQVRLLVGFSLIFSIVFAGAYYWFYDYSTDFAMKRIEEDLLDTLNGASTGVDADEFAALAQDGVVREDGYTDDPRYWSHVAWLVKVGETEPRAKLYSYIMGEKSNEVIFIGSIGAVLDPPAGAKFKEPYETAVKDGVNILTGLDHVAIKKELYEDKWGSWMSGYGPIVNSKGEKVGAIGVDIPIDYVKEVQQGIGKALIVSFVITYIILLALVYTISTLFTRPIVALTHTAERIGDGDYDQDLSNLTRGRFRDEMSSLAGVFQIMVDKVRQREQKLIRQVQELRIQIDDSRMKQQVGEIVETEFFQNLQEKARKMREERGGK